MVVSGVAVSRRPAAHSHDSRRIHELARVNIPQPAFYLLRLDGHVGLAGIQPDLVAVTRYASGRLHLETQRLR